MNSKSQKNDDSEYEKSGRGQQDNSEKTIILERKNLTKDNCEKEKPEKGQFSEGKI